MESKTPLTNEQIDILRAWIHSAGKGYMHLHGDTLCDMALALSEARRDAERYKWFVEKYPIDLLKVLNDYYDNMDDKTVREAIDAAIAKGGK